MLCRRWEVQTTCPGIHAHTRSHTHTCSLTSCENFDFDLSHKTQQCKKKGSANCRHLELCKDNLLPNPTVLERQLCLYNLYHYIYFLGLLKQTTKTWFIKTDSAISLSVPKSKIGFARLKWRSLELYFSKDSEKLLLTSCSFEGATDMSWLVSLIL